MHRAIRILGIVAILAASLTFPVGASEEMTNETPQLWFVEMPSAPTADGTSLTTVQKEKSTFRSNAAKAGLVYTERYAFDTLWNGLAISLAASDVSKLYRIAGVKAVYPVASVPLGEPILLDDPELATALAMTGADVAQSELGYTGAGIKVAVMDTGVDYDHADLGGDGVQRTNSSAFPTTRVVAGWDFVGDAFNADPTSPFYNPNPVPDAYPDDCNGHGTHVAGIVGANGAVVGVAPGVTFGAYRVFGCQGSTTADIMIAAMERALADDMDVLNMSIGAAFQWPQYPTATASNRLVNKGMVVVASIGNSGANGLYSASAPGLGEKVIGVASFDNTFVNLAKFTITPDDASIGYANATGAPPAPLSGTFPMKRTGTATTSNDACAALPAGSLAGHVALIRRGTCTFHTKSLNAQNAGAVAVVLYNNVAGRFSPTVAGVPAITIPVVAVSDVEGVLINNRLATGPVDMTWTNETFTTANPTGGKISSFSSYGLAADLTLKPDIGAPGGLIRSTYPMESGSYATISGTSMAAPHVAGGVALLLQAKPNTPSNAVRNILQNSADPQPHVSVSGLDNVHRQGAGLLDIDDAITATTKIEPGKLSLGESAAGAATRTLTIENNGSASETYTLSHVTALSTGSNTFTPSFVTSDATASFSSSSVTVPAGGTASVNVTITPATTPDRGQYGGYIVLTAQSSSQVYRVPYAGFIGDYQSITVLTPTVNAFPWLAKLVGASFTKQSAGAVYTLTGGDLPYILVHLDHQVRRLRLEVFDANTGKAWHRALDVEYFGRNSAATSFFAFTFDGTTVNGSKTYVVPDGQYTIKLSVQKALGDDNNTAHWEYWTSPMFVIDRP